MSQKTEQLEFFEIPSPCRGICENNLKGFCKGCYRSRDERFYWRQLSPGQKRDVLRLCRYRRYRERVDAMPKAAEHGDENLELF